MGDFSVEASGDGFTVVSRHDDAPMGMGTVTLRSIYAADGSPVPTFEHLVPEVPMSSVEMDTFSRVLDAFVSSHSNRIDSVMKHHDWGRVLAYLVSMADSPANNALVHGNVDMPGPPRHHNRLSKWSSIPDGLTLSKLGNGSNANRPTGSFDTRLKRTVALVSYYGPNAVSLYSRGITDDAVHWMLMVGTRNFGVQRLMTMYVLLHCRNEYESLSVNDAGNAYGLHYKDLHYDGIITYVPRLGIPTDDSTGQPVKVRDKIPDYPVFTEDSIRIMNAIGIDKVVRLMDLIEKVPCGSNGLSTAKLYRVAYDVLGYAEMPVYETLVKTLETMRDSTLPVVSGEDFTAEWLLDKAGIPMSVYLDDLRSGVYSDSVATELRDSYCMLMQRIMASPLVGYDDLLKQNDTWVSKAGTVVHSWSEQPVSCRNRLSECMDMEEQMENPWDVAVLLMCMMHDDGESRLLYRFMGMTGWTMLASMQKYTDDTRGAKSSYLAEHMRNRPDAGIMHRVNNVLSWFCSMDDDMFNRVLAIPFNAVLYETPTSMVMYYDKRGITEAPLCIMMGDADNIRVSNDISDDEYYALFPGSLERVTTWFESAMNASDGQTNGIERLDKLSTAISDYDDSGSMLYPESFSAAGGNHGPNTSKMPRRLSAIPYDEKMRTMISKNNAASTYPATDETALFTSSYDAYYSSPCYDQLHTPASLMEKEYITNGTQPSSTILPIRTMDDDGETISENTTLVNLFPDMDTYINDEDPANTKKAKAIERQAKRTITVKQDEWNATFSP